MQYNPPRKVKNTMATRRRKGTKQTERITRYEKIMREAERMIDEDAAEDAETLRGYISELEAYYASDEWKQDFADDEAGLLPADLKRGVLSEDGIYDLLEKYRETYLKDGE